VWVYTFSVISRSEWPSRACAVFERFAVCMQKRRVSVSERVPRYPWLPDPIARRRKLPVVQVFVAERSAFDGLKNQVVGRFRSNPRVLIFQHTTKC